MSNPTCHTIGVNMNTVTRWMVCGVLIMCATHMLQAQFLWEPVARIRFGVPGTELVTTASGEPLMVTGDNVLVRAGSTWVEGQGLPELGRKYGMFRSHTGALFVRTPTPFSSTDNGLTWHPVGTPGFVPTHGTSDATYSLDIQGNPFLRSSDDGATWTDATHPFGAGMFTLTASARSKHLIAWRQAAGVLELAYSADGAATWKRMNEKFEDGSISSIHVGPARTIASVRVGVEFRLYENLHGTDAWSVLSVSDALFMDVADLTETISLGVIDGRIVRSIDRGKSWVDLLIEPACTNHSFDPVGIYVPYDGAALVLTTSDGLLMTDDAGATWQRLGPETVADANVRVVRDFVFGLSGTLAWKSETRGDNWTCSNSVPDDIDNSYNWYRSAAGPIISTDEGASWSPVEGALQPDVSRVFHDIVATQAGALLYTFSTAASDWTGIVMRRAAPGGEWNPVLWIPPPVSATFVQSSNGRLYLVNNNGTDISPLYRSDDDGATWVLVDSLNPHRRITADREGNVYSLSGDASGHRALRSTDEGETWSELLPDAANVIDLMGLDDVVYAIVESEAGERTVQYALFHDGPFYETNYRIENRKPLQLQSGIDLSAFLRTDSGVYRSKLVLGIDDRRDEVAGNLMIIPNPVRTGLTARISGAPEGRLSYRVVAVDGQIVLSGSRDGGSDGSLSLNVSRLPIGTYILAVRDKSGMEYRGEVVVVR